jgi:hypothetical protein
VKAGALAAMEAAETYRAAGTLNQSLESARGVQRLDVSVDAAFDRPADRFRTNQTVTLAGQRIEVSQYFVDGTLYQYSPINRQQYGSAWIRLNLSTNASAFFDAADTLTRQRAVLNVSTVELNGTATVDGVEAHVLDADATNATLTALGSVGAPDAGLNVSSLSGRFYVARDDGRLLRSVVTLNASVTQQGTTVDVTQTADLRFFDYGTDVSIVLPPGAEDAVRPEGEGGTF